MEFRDRLSEPDRRAFDRFVRTYGEFGGKREQRTVPLEVEETGASLGTDAAFITKGHAAVFNRKSLDLGGFQERIDPGAFDGALDADPDVHLLWDHDTRLALARTRSGKYLLELREDPKGLHYYARIAPTTFAADLRVLMEGGVIDQASFAFTVAEDTWEEVNRGKDNEYVLRTIHKVDQLFDVTITAQGAYPQTDSQVVRQYAKAYAEAQDRLAHPDDPDEGEPEERGVQDVPEGAAPDEPADTEAADVAQDDPEGGPESRTEDAGSEVQSNLLLRTVRMQAQHALDRHRLKREGYHPEGDDDEGGGTPPAA